MKFVAAMLIALAFVSAAQADDAENGELSDVQDVLFLSPQRPLFIRLHIRVDGRSYRELPDELAERLFTALDGNEDGALDEQEAQRIPPRNRFRDGSPSMPLRVNEIDTNQDGGIDPSELRQYVRDSSEKSLQVDRGAARRRVDVDLFARLDTDQDLMVTDSEIQAAPARYAKYDIDDDETLSALEFAPLATEAEEQTSYAGTAPFPLDNSRWQSDVALQILKIYGEAPFDKPPGRRVNREQLGVDEATFARLDKNADGDLTLMELTPLVQDPMPQLEFLIELGTKGRRLKITPLREVDGVDIRPGRSGRLVLVIGDTEILLDADRTGVTARDDSKMFRLRFLQSDGDKNGYLDENEFGGLQLPGAAFAAVDRDGDGMVVVEEVSRFVEQQSSLARNQAKLTVAANGKSLFEMLDVNTDRRLSRREFRSAMSRLREWDADRNGRLALTEIPNKYNLTFAVGQSLLFPADGQGPRPMNLEPRRPEAKTSAPVWFQKMDRNRDGDVSEREFLGPLTTFRRIDRDGDGLIDVAEADAVEVADGQDAGANSEGTEP